MFVISEGLKIRLLRLKALIIKEFFSIWRDKKSRTVIFLPPLLQLFIFSYAATLDITNVSIAIYDNDNSILSRTFIKRIEHSRYFSKIVKLNNVKEIKNAIDTEKVRVAVFIQNDFSKKYYSKESPQIEVMLDGRHTNAAQIILGYVQEIASTFMLEDSLPSAKIQIVQRNWYNPNLYYHWFIIASLVGILPMVVAILLASLSLAREKEFGTFDQLLVSPLKPYEILAGKIIPPLFFGVFDGLVIALIAYFYFKIPFYGSLALFLGALVFFLLAIVGVGLFISSICKTQQQATLGVFVFMFPAMILSGYVAPIENITPQLLQNLTIVNPLRFFLVISKGIMLKNMRSGDVIINLIPILIIALCTLLIANYTFEKKLE